MAAGLGITALDRTGAWADDLLDRGIELDRRRGPRVDGQLDPRAVKLARRRLGMKLQAEPAVDAIRAAVGEPQRAVVPRWFRQVTDVLMDEAADREHVLERRGKPEL